ncbi:hypothetical protein CROQUDRAFT_135915 [Cronartium quercuum f. sp. fusiforme G11]|uniref:Uncharacterized protein n=1 Tax=Cronartium quercuum f. sp. fusiforme G11 TaxID=708437 RepID=A0A9P6N8I4_9BASI|nr:hypothetical protein CROQUDRAFT_135915 [Cronartium quercuum f. sp. fusiforme G11]
MSELNLCASYSDVNKAEFIVDAVLFDMDGTLVDSIPAIESAWAAVAKKLDRDPQVLIDETHGRRVQDNLKDIYPHLRKMSDAEMQPHVREFEIEILRQADEYGVEVKSRRSSAASSRNASRSASFVGSPSEPGAGAADKDHKPRRKSNLSNNITAEGVSSRMAAMGIKPLSTANSSTSIKTVAKPVQESSLAENLAKKKLNTLNASASQDVFEDDDSDSEIEIDVSDLVDLAHCGATWLIPTLDLVQVEVLADGRIRIFIDATASQVEQAISESVRGKIAAKRV